MEIRNRIVKTELIDWQKAKWFQGELKSITKESFEKLKSSLRQNGFVLPLNVWENGEVWILDGHSRRRVMEELKKEGVEIPALLPANFIDCQDEKEAKKLVLVYSSIYARIFEESLHDFFHLNELNFDLLKMEIDLPEINLEHFADMWMRNKNFSPVGIDEQSKLDEKSPIKCPNCGQEFVPS